MKKPTLKLIAELIIINLALLTLLIFISYKPQQTTKAHYNYIDGKITEISLHKTINNTINVWNVSMERKNHSYHYEMVFSGEIPPSNTPLLMYFHVDDIDPSCPCYYYIIDDFDVISG